MSDLFRKLSAGARFSHQDMQRAKREKYQSVPATPLDTSVPDELDFFKSSRPSSGHADQGPPAPKTAIKIPTKPVFKAAADMHAFMKKKGIRVHGADVPPPVRRLCDLGRPEVGVPCHLLQTLLERGIGKLTPVQMQGTPVLLAGRDAFIIAPTGSGKTLVFILSLISQLLRGAEDGRGKIQAIIVSPTRELAMQIKDEFRKFTPPVDTRLQQKPTKRTSSGKPAISSVLLNKAVLNSWQMTPPKSFPHVLITTPQRLVQAIETRAVDLSAVQHIILDEGDKLLEMGLMGQLDDILAACTLADGPIQKALLSATIPSGVEDLARSFMNEDPVKIVVGTPNAATRTIDQQLLYVGQEEGKLMAIRQLLVQGGLEPPVIIFTETIERATALFHELVRHGVNVEAIHSGRTQAERERIVAQFRAGRLWFLITTELLARGLDFPEVACVINYDFPLSTASYIHRIGRTGRAGKQGKAITLYTQQDAPALKIVANVMKQSGCPVPEWMLQLKRRSNASLLKGLKRGDSGRDHASRRSNKKPRND